MNQQELYSSKMSNVYHETGAPITSTSHMTNTWNETGPATVKTTEYATGSFAHGGAPGIQSITHSGLTGPGYTSGGTYTTARGGYTSGQQYTTSAGGYTTATGSVPVHRPVLGNVISGDVHQVQLTGPHGGGGSYLHASGDIAMPGGTRKVSYKGGSYNVGGTTQYGSSTNVYGAGSTYGATTGNRTVMGETTTTTNRGELRWEEKRVFSGEAARTYTLDGTTQIIGERVVEHEVKVPKKVIREDYIEKIIVVPEKVLHEEVVEEIAMVRERIVEVAKPIYQEKIVEVAETEYVEKIVEVAEKIIQEKLIEIPKIEIKERIHEVAKIIQQEKVVEVPEIEYREIPYEKIVEVPEIREQVVVKEVPVPQYVDKPYAEHVTVEVKEDVERRVPIPVEVETTWEYQLPKLRGVPKKVPVTLFVPRFVEVPVHASLLSESIKAESMALAEQVSAIAAQHAISMCEVENTAAAFKQINIEQAFSDNNALALNLRNAWNSSQVQVTTARHVGPTVQASGMTREVRHGYTESRPVHGETSKMTPRGSDIGRSRQSRPQAKSQKDTRVNDKDFGQRAQEFLQEIFPWGSSNNPSSSQKPAANNRAKQSRRT